MTTEPADPEDGQGSWMWAWLLWPPATLATAAAGLVVLVEGLLALHGGGVSPGFGMFAFVLMVAGNVGLFLAPVVIARPHRPGLGGLCHVALGVGGALYGVLALVAGVDLVGLSNVLWFLERTELTVIVLGATLILVLHAIAWIRIRKPS